MPTMASVDSEITPTPPPKQKKHPKKAYGAGDRRALDRLFEASGSGGTQKP